METIMDNWPIILAAAIPAIEMFIGALPNNMVPYRSIILKILKAIDEK